MLINPPYPHPVADVQPHGLLAIPNLPWVPLTPPLLLPDLRSFKGMYTIVCNAGFELILNYYLPHVQTSQQLVAADINALENRILEDIEKVVANGPPHAENPLLKHIAVGIQLWGGIAGRGVFVRGPGFEHNVPMGVYVNLVALVLAQLAEGPLVVEDLIEAANAFNFLGVAFLTKHLSFWSRAPRVPIQLPILDKIVMQRFFHPRDNPTWSYYNNYIISLNADREAVVNMYPHLAGITVIDMERQLFNWLKTPAAAPWVR